MFENKKYIRFSNENCVEVMAMKDQERALREKPKRARTYKTKDAYGDEIECYESFPGLTVEQMKDLSGSDALQYMEGPLMPYTAAVDPHTLKTMGSIKRGEPCTVKTLTALVTKCRKKLEEQHGKGVARKLWNRVNDTAVKIDLLLGAGKVKEAKKVFRALEKDVPRPPEALKTRIDAMRDSIK